jgi:hypothetical protein
MKPALVHLIGLVALGTMIAAGASCGSDDAQTDGGPGGWGGGGGDGGGGGLEVSCTGEFCADIIAYCEVAVPGNWGGWGDLGMQKCVDGLQTNYALCQYPKNIASCYAECVQESTAGGGSKAEFEACAFDKQCSEFGNCPT